MRSGSELRAGELIRRMPEVARTTPFLLTLGILLAFWGERVFTRTSPSNPDLGTVQVFACMLLLLGALLFGLGVRRLRVTPSRLDFGDQGGDEAPVRWYEPRVGLALSLALAAMGIALFAWRGEGPLVIAFWLAGLLILFVAQFWRRGIRWPVRLAEEWPYLAGLGLVLVAALIARTYHLSTIPYNFDGDFGSMGLQARDLIAGRQTHIFAFGWATEPMLGFLPIALSMKLLGDGIVGLYGSGVAFGLLSIVGVYLLGRDLYQPRVGLIAAGLMAASYAHLAASRLAMMLDPVLALTLTLYFLLIGLREQRGWAVVGSGVAAAACFETYHAGQIVIPILAFLFLFLLLFHRGELFKRSGWLLLWLLALGVALGPMWVVFARNPSALYSRAQEVFILNPSALDHQMHAYNVSSLSATLWEQARRSALLFYYYVDNSPNFGFVRPFLDPITAPLFTLGLGVALLSMRRLGNALMCAWIVLGVTLGSFVMPNPPTWSHLMTLLPPTALLAAIAVDAIYEVVCAGLRQVSRPAGLLAAASLGVLIAIIGIRNWETYLQVKGTYADAQTRIARYVASQSPAAPAYLVTTANWGAEDRVFAFLAPGRFAAKLAPDDVAAGKLSLPAPSLLILTPDQSSVLAELQARFPTGRLYTGAGNSAGEVAFFAFRIPQ